MIVSQITGRKSRCAIEHQMLTSLPRYKCSARAGRSDPELPGNQSYRRLLTFISWFGLQHKAIGANPSIEGWCTVTYWGSVKQQYREYRATVHRDSLA